MFLAYLRGIETLHRQLDRGIGDFVFSLPKRDWNFFTINSINNFHLTVFSLPKRDWNVIVVAPPESRIAVFSLPKRDWNLLMVITTAGFDLVFSLPKRDWNTACYDDGDTDYTGF